MANTIVKTIALNQLIPDIRGYVDDTVSFAQGDHLILDTTNHLVRAPTSEAEGATYLGVAAVDIEDGVPESPYSTSNDGAISAPALNGPMYGVVAKMVLKTGDALNPGDNVYIYLTAGSRGVGSLSGATGTKAIGIYAGQEAISSADAGQEIEVHVGCRAPNDVLKF